MYEYHKIVVLQGIKAMSTKKKIFIAGLGIALIGLLLFAVMVYRNRTAINFAKETIVLETNTSSRLRVKEAKGKVTWSSADESIASISDKGILQTRNVGEVAITAKYNGEENTRTITVREPMRWYAHRGFSGEYPENTMPALTGALEAGFNGVEIDVFEASNGEILVFHDKTTERLCGKEGSIYDITVDNRKDFWITAGSNIGKYRSESKRLYIPTLDEAVEAMAKEGATMYIHIKGRNNVTDVGIDRVAEVLRKHDMVDKSIIICGKGSLLKKFGERGLNTGLSLDSKTLNNTSVEDKLEEGIKSGSKTFIIFHPSDVTPEIVERCKQEGITLGAYRVKKRKQATEMHNLGVEFVFCDYAFFK